MEMISKQTVWNELALALKRWDELNDKMARMEAVDQKEHLELRLKIQNLERLLEIEDSKKDVA